jgi:hypothetical protein
MGADSPLGVRALKALCEEMCVKDPLIKITYES